jgi:hypothetical protein
MMMPWRCEQCAASGTLILDDVDLDDSEETLARVTATHDAHPLAQRIACVAGPETVIRLVVPTPRASDPEERRADTDARARQVAVTVIIGSRSGPGP